MFPSRTFDLDTIRSIYLHPRRSDPSCSPDCHPAHLTNPSETSFRTFLTEQSFRQHLSRLDQQPADADAAAADDFALPHSHPRPGFDRPVHFASRAAVSLRTPKHVTHSLGVLTLAAVVPDAHARAARADCAACSTDLERAAVTDAWFVGAFGKWWRGGALDPWWLDSVSKGKADDASWSSGILGIKSLDRVPPVNGNRVFCTRSATC
jgi:hypothetical protein